MGTKRNFESEAAVISYLKKNGFEAGKDSKLLTATKTIGIHTMGIADFAKSKYKYTVVY
jgi:hypothetical protein